jgi:biopolymer transport protein TolR
MSSATHRLRKRKLKSEINVVPYIDVMLVLLIIFMITAPLLNLGVDIDLPKSDAKPVQLNQSPIQITVARDGTYKLRLPDGRDEAVDLPALGAKLAAVAKSNPDISVVIAGDKNVSYDAVWQAMSYVSVAGINKISLISKPAEGH